ncbi:Peptidyl-prolyl cis-trans isomerase FKBP16-3 [Durusdinium trenchii]|uniref:Chloroplastic (PPIase FKBP16-3) (FK506-binding protein 16-3) (AtFKBP16-3) (Immunophilin FKBP16-3) (Rotamase) n=1 Tax=Durusdinium trenchii TaxID=1381693 RepID=A0ABP0LM92_9DINO
MARPQRRLQVLLLCLSALALQKTFVPEPLTRKVEVQTEEVEAVSRAHLRLLPLMSFGLSLPAQADKGVTTAWKVRPDGGEDDVHLGGVEWEDVKVGTGSSPQIGDQIACRYQLKAYIREREVIVEDLTKGSAKDFRRLTPCALTPFGSISFPGMVGMKTGGVRKMRIPGNLAFGEKALPAAPGRMALPPFQPVEATVPRQC